MIQRQPSPHGQFELTETKGVWRRRYIFDDDVHQQPASTSRTWLQELCIPVGYPTSVEPGYFRYVASTAVVEACNIIMLVLSLSAFFSRSIGSSATLFVVFREVLTGVAQLALNQHLGTSIVFSAKQWRVRIELIAECMRLLELLFAASPYFPVVTGVGVVVDGVLNGSRHIVNSKILTNFSRTNNVADLLEKSQNITTLVRVIASLAGWLLLSVFGDLTGAGRFVFVAVLVAHTAANALSANLLVFKSINYERLAILMTYFTQFKSPRAATHAQARSSRRRPSRAWSPAS